MSASDTPLPVPPVTRRRLPIVPPQRLRHATSHLVLVGTLLTTLVSVALPSSANADAALVHLGPGQTEQIDAGDRVDSLLTYGDGQWECAFAWQYGGVVPPDWGAFAECFSGNWLLVAVVLDFTTLQGYHHGQTCDVYAWADDEGIPGAAMYVMPGYDPGPIGLWPNITRHHATLPEPFAVDGSWWVGFWPGWPGQQAGWFIAGDHDSPTQGCMLTHVAPGIGYSTGWISWELVYGPHRAFGVSALVRPAPVPSVEATWGGIKSLYRRSTR